MSNFFFILAKEFYHVHIKVKLMHIVVIEVLANHFVCAVLSIANEEAYMGVLHAVEVVLS